MLILAVRKNDPGLSGRIEARIRLTLPQTTQNHSVHSVASGRHKITENLDPYLDRA